MSKIKFFLASIVNPVSFCRVFSLASFYLSYGEFPDFFHSLQGTQSTSTRSKLVTSNSYKNKPQSTDITKMLSTTNTETTNTTSYKCISCFESKIHDLILLNRTPTMKNNLTWGLQTKPSILTDLLNYFHSITLLTRTLKKYFSAGKCKWSLIHDSLHGSF